MNKVYTCPVCGKTYTDLDKLTVCLENDKKVLKAKVEEDNIVKTRYLSCIKESRESIEKTYDTLKTKIEAYNRLVAEAAQKTDIVAATCSISSPLFKTVKTIKTNACDKDVVTDFMNNKDFRDFIYKTLGF